VKIRFTLYWKRRRNWRKVYLEQLCNGVGYDATPGTVQLVVCDPDRGSGRGGAGVIAKSCRLSLCLLAVCLLLVGIGCASKVPSPKPAPVKPLSSGGAGQARQAYAQARYDEAKSGYEGVLESATGPLRMEALYHLAVIELVHDPKARSFAKARTHLGEVKVNSDYKRAEVQAILELLVTLEETRATLHQRTSTLRTQQETLAEQEQSIQQKEEALRSVTETIIGGGED